MIEASHTTINQQILNDAIDDDDQSNQLNN
jgi:hypothetical protein